jgi:hypothetical protein
MRGSEKAAAMNCSRLRCNGFVISPEVRRDGCWPGSASCDGVLAGAVDGWRGRGRIYVMRRKVAV